MKKLTGKEYMVLAVEAVLLLLLLFGKWLSLPFYHTTLLHFGRIVSSLSSYANSGLFTILTILMYVGLIAAIISLVVTVMAIFKSEEEKKKKKHILYGFYVPGVFALFIILLVIVANAAIKSSSEGWFSNVVSLTATPFLAIILSVGGLVAYQKLPDASFDVVRDTVKNKVGHMVDAVSKEAVVCPSCGAKCKEGVGFCAQCGAKLPAAVNHICAKCGKKFSAGVKFCPDCGTQVEDPVNNTVNADKSE